MDLVVRFASPEDGHPPGLSLAEVTDGVGPMALCEPQQVVCANWQKTLLES